MIYSRVYYKNSYYSKIKIPSIFSKKYLIIWKPKHETKYHDHNNMKCEFVLLHGLLNQSIIFNNKEKKIYKLNKYEINYIDDNIGKHKIINDNNYSITYHKYY